MFSFNFGQKFDVNHPHPPPPLLRGKNRQKNRFFLGDVFVFHLFFFTCSTAVAGTSGFLPSFFGRLYSKID